MSSIVKEQTQPGIRGLQGCRSDALRIQAAVANGRRRRDGQKCAGGKERAWTRLRIDGRVAS